MSMEAKTKQNNKSNSKYSLFSIKCNDYEQYFCRDDSGRSIDELLKDFHFAKNNNGINDLAKNCTQLQAIEYTYLEQKGTEYEPPTKNSPTYSVEINMMDNKLRIWNGKDFIYQNLDEAVAIALNKEENSFSITKNSFSTYNDIDYEDDEDLEL